MTRRFWTPLWIAISISSLLFGHLRECTAQNTLTTEEYDYHALALTAISNSAREASKLKDIPQRVRILLYAAKTLAPYQHNEATRFLDIALGDLKQWTSAEKTSTYEQHTASALRNEVLALYAQLNPKKAAVLRKEFLAEARSRTPGESEISLKSKSWLTQFAERSAVADQRAKMALALIESEPEKALRLVVHSLQAGTISSILFDISDKLIQNRNRTLLNRLEITIAQGLEETSMLDPDSITYAALLVLADKEMPSATRTAFINFLMRSLQAWASVAKEAGTDTSYISRGFFAFSQTVRRVISQYAPDRLVLFNSVLNQAADLVPERMKSVTRVLPPETFVDPRERLNDILKDPAPEIRDDRLIRFVSQLLRNEPNSSDKRFDLIAEAINGLNDTEAKAAFTELLTITRIDSLAKQKRFLEAQELTGSISSEETRAWALLALAKAAAKADQVLGFDMITNALKVLYGAPSGPQKVELGLMATATLTESDEQRAFGMLSTVVKYANASPAKIDAPSKHAYASGIEASIEQSPIRLGLFPETLGDLRIDPALSTLATTDWFRADQIVDDVRDVGLRIRLRLQLAAAVLADESARNKNKLGKKTNPR
ncbi:MAG TPA: hypothetical protein VJU84_05340 [Pyrinomonadaceae bacterium]|nr:hypothetical protein [Pyrinomonadaceae bacterium]